MKKTIIYAMLLTFAFSAWTKAIAGETKLSSLCDEWNVLKRMNGSLEPDESTYFTLKYHLTTDTVIEGKSYVRIEEGTSYRGALREGENSMVYFCPPDSTREFLLYAFKSKVGDVLENAWLGPNPTPEVKVKKVTVAEIQSENPKIFVLDVECQQDEIDYHKQIRWIDGIGFDSTPDGLPGLYPIAGGPVYSILCAYNEGQQVYSSKEVSVFGCEFNGKMSHATTWYGVYYYKPYDDSPTTITDLTYTLGGDTIIKEKIYRKILFTNEAQKIKDAYRGAIRQTTYGQQVYFVPCGSQTEYLLYNFDVKPGDVVNAYSGFCDVSCEQMAKEDPDWTRGPIVAYIVSDVQVIDGRKHVYLQGGGLWIERVGTKHILWQQGRGCYPTGMDYFSDYTLCAADKFGEILYSFNTDELGIKNNCPTWEPMAIDNVQVETHSATKIFRNGQILIERNGKTYTLTGGEWSDGTATY